MGVYIDTRACRIACDLWRCVYKGVGDFQAFGQVEGFQDGRGHAVQVGGLPILGKVPCADFGKRPVRQLAIRLAADEVPVTGYGSGHAVDVPVEVAGSVWRMTAVSMGNPHCVVFVDDVASVPIERIGHLFETQARFPKKTNTEFVQVLDRTHLRMRVWERGAAITLACGTGSCATLVAAVLTGRSERAADIILDGGTLHNEWAADNHLYMTGPAVEVFSGTVEV